jgi:hypothetical protein
MFMTFVAIAPQFELGRFYGACRAGFVQTGAALFHHFNIYSTIMI